MSNGPIEFLGESAGHEVPSTEMGGADGLIQPAKAEQLSGDVSASGGHNDEALLNGEVAGMMMRKATEPLDAREQVTGESSVGERIEDPVTGRVVPPSRVKAGATGQPGELSDLQPGR
jgi:hypothetical protein